MIHHSVWLPRPDVTRHAGSVIPREMEFFVSPPLEIGPIISAESTLTTSTEAGLTPSRLRACLFWALTGAAIGWGIALVNDIAPANLMVIVGSVAALIAYGVTRFSHRCSYVGESGIAIYRLTGDRTARPKAEILCFKDATNLYTSQTRQYVNGVYTGTMYSYDWSKRAGQKYKLSGQYRSERGWPEDKDAWHFANAAEAAWNNALLPMVNEQLARSGYVEFPLSGHLQAVRVGSGFMEFVTRDSLPQRVQVADMKDITLDSGVFRFKHIDARWWSGKGKYSFTYSTIPNAKLFLLSLDRLTGIRWHQNPAQPAHHPPQPGVRGDDLRLDLALSFHEAIFGCEKEIQIQHLELIASDTLAPVIKKLTVTIPAGVDSGTRLRITGEGDASQVGGESGDLYIYLEAESAAGAFKREDIDIISELKITAEQARQGSKMTVPTIDGETPIAIPPGTKRGDRLKIAGHGVPKLGSPQQRGEHIVCIDV